MSTAVTALITLFVVGLVPLAPTEPVLVGMGVLAASGKVPLAAVIVTAAIACSLSDHFLYVVGRVGGGWAMQRLVRRPSVRSAHEWLTARITKWGSLVLVVGRWLPAGGTIGALLTGSLRWRLLRFTPASVLGSALWSTYVALIGYFGGALTGQPFVGLLVSLAIALILGVTSSFVFRRTQAAAKRRAEADVPTGGPGHGVGEEPLVAG